MDTTNDLRNYYLSKYDVEASSFDHTLSTEEYIHHINNTPTKLKTVIKQATHLRSKFEVEVEVDLDKAVIEHTHL
jgi:glutaredoxin 2